MDGSMSVKVTPSEARELLRLLVQLYQEQAAFTGATPYLAEHSRVAAITHHVSVFAWYRQYLSAGQTVLDWGCNHGPDSCLVRKTFGDLIEIHGCDFADAGEFRAFRDYSRQRYTQLSHPTDLPYADNTFDVVIGSGVLEHTAMDQQALAGLYRIVKPDGLLILTYLPYRWSWNEWYRRRVRKRDYHRRLYGMTEAATLLKRCGFYPLELRFQTYLANALDGPWKSLAKRSYRRLRYHFASHDVMCCAARKMTVM
jgi:SAM-dependent methyltransferase